MNWPALKEPLGFFRDHPSHGTTISRTLARASHEQLQGTLTGWVARVVADQELNASVDGKWARQSGVRIPSQGLRRTRSRPSLG